MNKKNKPLRVAVLVDLPRTPVSGGHVKSWERLAVAASHSDLPLDLTLYCLGDPTTEALSDKARVKHVLPVFSTQRLTFLPYTPDHTDLAHYNPNLGTELPDYDVIHTTDGFFAFARTAEKINLTNGVPITTSFHTDTPAYAEIFTRLAIEEKIGDGFWGRLLLQKLQMPERQRKKQQKRLETHLAACCGALYTREEDGALASSILGDDNVARLRLGVDRTLFGPHKKDRRALEDQYSLSSEHVVVLFVGRLDVGKNIYTLIEALERLIAEGKQIHLITAGLGPAENDLRERLGNKVTVAGFVEPDDLAMLYASVDVLALTSEVEIRSMAGIEAMTSGLPILVSEKSGIAKLFDYTPAMNVVPSGADAWADALRSIVSSTNNRAHMSKVALSYANSYIADWEDILAKDLFPMWEKAALKDKQI